MKKLLFFFLIGTFAFSQEPIDSVKLRADAKAKFDSLMAEVDKSIKRIDGLIKKEMDSKSMFKAKKITELTKNDLKGFNVEYDKFKKASFIYAKSGWTDKFYPYIALSDDGYMTLRLVTIYRGSSWVFFDNVQLIIDGKDFTYNVDETYREVSSSATVFEKSDIQVDEHILEILNAVANSKEKISIRFNGERYSDKTIYVKEAEITKRILELFEKLKIE